jgi:hypothetical protein
MKHGSKFESDRGDGNDNGDGANPFDEFNQFSRRSMASVLPEVAQRRQTVSPDETIIKAQVAVLDYYNAARAQLDAHWWRSALLALAVFYGVIAYFLPLLGFLTGMWIDIAVFGGAVESLIEVSPIYLAFAAGSLVFAVGSAIVPRERQMLMLILCAFACFGASVIAADNPKFRAIFADMLVGLKSDQETKERGLGTLRADIDAHKREIKAIDAKLNPPLPQRPMIDDGTTDNDDLARALEQKADDLRGEVRKMEAKLGGETVALTQAGKKSWAQFWGRLLAGGYIFCWLLGAQLVISAVIARAGPLFRERRALAIAERYRAHLVQRLQHPDPEARRAAATEEVNRVLMLDFDPVLTLAGSADPDKLVRYTALFDGATLQRIVDGAVDLVCRSLDSMADAQRSGRRR